MGHRRKVNDCRGCKCTPIQGRDGVCPRAAWDRCEAAAHSNSGYRWPNHSCVGEVAAPRRLLSAAGLRWQRLQLVLRLGKGLEIKVIDGRELRECQSASFQALYGVCG